MSRKKIMIYIEGEGGGGTAAKRRYFDGAFRKSWKSFLQPLADYADSKGIASFQCIPGRGGSATSSLFSNPLPKDEDALRILIIDSEGPVADICKPWEAIQKACPIWADNDNCYLMVQCLETWLLADPDSLKKHYNRHKGCFSDKSIKEWPNLEQIDRKVL